MCSTSLTRREIDFSVARTQNDDPMWAPCAPNKQPNRNNSSQTAYAFKQCDGRPLRSKPIHTQTQTRASQRAHIRRITEILEALNRVNWKIKQKPKFSGNHSTLAVCACARVSYITVGMLLHCALLYCVGWYATSISDFWENARARSLAFTRSLAHKKI